jgi:hypothetical protein
MAQQQIAYFVSATTKRKFYCKGQITAFGFSLVLVFVLGEHAGFEPYTKVGVIVPVHGTLR